MPFTGGQRSARFSSWAPLNEFDWWMDRQFVGKKAHKDRWYWNNSIKRQRPIALRDLGTCHFIEQHRNIVIGGPPGIGKTHAAKAIGHQACRGGYQVLFRQTQRLLSDLCADSAERADRELRYAIKVDLLILDDFAFRKLDQKEAEALYVLAEARLGTASTILTSNRPPEDWYATFPDPVVGGAILDRMVSAAIKIITTKGRSYRREVMGRTARSSQTLGTAT